MYLVSIYFDEETENRINSYMKQIAKYTKNTAMLDGNVPPHITIAAFQTESETQAIEIFEKVGKEIMPGNLQWVSVGSFLPQVIYISPVLNEYLHRLTEMYNKEITHWEGAWVDARYQPYGWLPHTTLAKHLTKEQMTKAFEVMQNQFGPFSGCVTKIGLAKTNPYKDIRIINLK